MKSQRVAPWVAAVACVGVVGCGMVPMQPQEGGRYQAAPRPEARQPEAGQNPWQAPTGPSPLEQVAEIETKLEESEERGTKLQAELDSRNATMDQLRSDNERLRNATESLSAERDSLMSALDSKGSQERSMNEEKRELMAELLAERIRRLRVERELILGEIAKAENDGQG